MGQVCARHCGLQAFFPARPAPLRLRAAQKTRFFPFDQLTGSRIVEHGGQATVRGNL
jgi:hypothetical protein